MNLRLRPVCMDCTACRGPSDKRIHDEASLQLGSHLRGLVLVATGAFTVCRWEMNAPPGNGLFCTVSAAAKAVFPVVLRLVPVPPAAFGRCRADSDTSATPHRARHGRIPVSRNAGQRNCRSGLRPPMLTGLSVRTWRQRRSQPCLGYRCRPHQERHPPRRVTPQKANGLAYLPAGRFLSP